MQRTMKHQNNDIQNKTILIMTVIIVMLTIILVGISIFSGSLMDYNIIGASVSVLSIVVALIIGYQIINVLEIKSEMKNQNAKIERIKDEIQAAMDGKIKEVDGRMKDVGEELLFQKNRVDEQLQSIVKQEIVINQLLAKRSINSPYEYWQAMSYQVDALKTALSYNMKESMELCTELFEYAFCAYSKVWDLDNSEYIEKIDRLRKLVEVSPNKPFLFLLDIVDEAVNMAKKTYGLGLIKENEEEKKGIEKRFNEAVAIVNAGWQTNGFSQEND